MWLASVHESAWHASSGSLSAACGHQLHGPVHGRRVAPDDPQRVICAACVQAIGYVEPHPARALLADPNAPTKRRHSLEQALDAFPHESSGEPLADWPPCDADELAAA